MNGTLGKIEHLTQDEVLVRFADGTTHLVEPVTWENKTYKWDQKNNTISFEIMGTFTQYPIRLAWAITITKVRGLHLKT